MATTIFCKTTGKGQQTYYLDFCGENIFLFRSAFRRSNKDYFAGGRPLCDVLSAKRNCSASVRAAADRIVSALKYVEKLHGITVFDRTANNNSKKHNRHMERARKACRGKVDLSKHIFDEVA